MFRPRAAMLTLYGDYVLYRGVEIGIGSLVKLLSNFDLSEQSVRSAVLRMCRAGLLKARQDGRKSYYSLTEEGMALLDEGYRRIFERKSGAWDGCWSVVVYFVPEEKREARDNLRQQLTWLGYGPLSTATWVSPHDLSDEVEGLAQKLRLKEYVQIFQAKHLGCGDPKTVISRCWDLDRIHKGYAGFISQHRARLDEHRGRIENGGDIDPSQFFTERFKLMHEYRRLPYFDPDLPEELLPEDWLRFQASSMFNEYHDILAEKAEKYFDSILKAY
ncbi:MAG: PaaX family transcriptional regulator C-terminal domain-containing protein [Dehalococcoidales bacterium]|nr:PaaX family transcriptional regulator C-terminal domain-containing protein [Dehalococcoidales bacterium]MDP7525706.1 PaaX family transcriptional regulator C-terminal domain-containing protein [Dehalococcoidales bacterium]